MKDDTKPVHQRLLPPADNKFHVGNGEDGKHYWLTPPELLDQLAAAYGPFDFDPCPFPKPEDFDGLTCEWGECNYVNPPFGSILHQGPEDKKPKKKGPTAWVRKAITEAEKGKRVVLVYPVDKWLLMLFEAGAKVSNLGDVRWLATEDGSAGKGTGRHIACFVLDGKKEPSNTGVQPPPADTAEIEALRAEVERWKGQHMRDSAELRRLCQHRDEYKARAERLAEALEEIRSRSCMNLAMNPNPYELTALLGDIHQIASASLAQENE